MAHRNGDGAAHGALQIHRRPAGNPRGGGHQLAVDLHRQLLPGTFEHALNHLLDHELDLSGFDARFSNDVTGATAYPPAMLLKVILFDPIY